MDEKRRSDLIQQYKDGYAEVSEALTGSSDDDLDRRPGPGKWTAREIVHHLADSETIAAVRLRLLLAEDRPTIIGYDQEKYARRLRYDRPIASSLQVLQAVQRATAELLDGLSEEDWRREGTHTESGAYSVERWLEIYAAHAHNHAAQILVARAVV